MKKILLTTTLLLVVPFASAMNAVMYQPQLRDTTVSDAQWQSVLSKLKGQGIDTLVLQWSRYDDAFTGGESRAWLERKAQLTTASSLKLVIGLAADGQFFERQKQPMPALENYLNHLRANDVAVAKRWVEVLGEQAISGWYISSELDDRRWRTPQMQQVAENWMNNTRLSLAAVADKPVAVSSFFAGNMTPDSYRKWITTLNHSGVKVWMQDGAGTQVLTETERALYLQAPSAGKVIELFRQDKQAETFKAQPAPAAYQQKLLSTPVPQGQDRIFFSLRYMSAANGVLAK
ncbi:DUF4434 domain-containing protein [Buttiauxella sp. A2-C2_NF]|uniref:DUF4434 domain-containing protein n=1 Tax=Buttiauxella ferragutiae TaxID=82989 RepID=UPI001E445257|nr:DUF4434 domain-containing protein [Buttiauxella ferragutiae]MCE0824600.1 DUF4434 domain-containing protein [Buttiauxella ferragutiae]UNK63594.1 DUF4434 domain-containing protein [Buttiauxella ferragutiae]